MGWNHYFWVVQIVGIVLLAYGKKAQAQDEANEDSGHRFKIVVVSDDLEAQGLYVEYVDASAKKVSSSLDVTHLTFDKSTATEDDQAKACKVYTVPEANVVHVKPFYDPR